MHQHHRITKRDLIIPKRKTDTHKGQSGKVLIIGGSESLVGAPILASLGAFRSGVDLVHVVAPSKVAWAINTYNPSIITHKLPGRSFQEKHTSTILKLCSEADAVLLGNGIGRGPNQKLFVHSLLKKITNPLVIDADALHYTDFAEIHSGQFICTPHQKEYAILEENSHHINSTQNKVILRKGATDSILADKEYENVTGCPEMAVAGTGDVLAGMCVGFLAQGLTAQQSAINAAYLTGKAGERAKKEIGNFTADELIRFLHI